VLRTNLSTRPFYNERAVHAVLAIAAILVLAVTALNVVRIVRLSRHNTQLSARVARDRGEADRLTAEAARIRRGLDQKELQLVVDAAREANGLIDQRTFSWTEFFNRIEATLPPDVMLSAVRPTVDENGTRVQMVVLGRRTEDVDEFVEKLEATGAFEDVLPQQQETTEEGLQRVVINSWYVTAAPEGTGGTP
jgi:hypothetical protein